MENIPLRVYDLAGKRHEFSVPPGSNLRHILRQNHLSPYVPLTEKLNCGGHGLCATCGVWIEEGVPEPEHWHDWAARRFGYPCLSCQITVDRPMTVRLVEKWIWGRPRRGQR